METVRNSESPLVRTAVIVGRTLGQLAARLDGFRGKTREARDLQAVLDATLQRVRQQPHQPTEQGIGALAEIARIRDAS